MFTGLVQDVGSFDTLSKVSEHFHLKINSSLKNQNLQIGDSIAIDGVCLTVLKFEETALYFELSQETIQKTLFSLKKRGDLLNIEVALSAQDKIGGHFCQCHVESLATVEKIILQDQCKEIEFSFPLEFKNLIVEKGSILLNGVSLTTFDIQENHFKVALIPLTLKNTNLSSLKIFDQVHLETDIIARYIQKSLSPYLHQFNASHQK